MNHSFKIKSVGSIESSSRTGALPDDGLAQIESAFVAAMREGDAPKAEALIGSLRRIWTERDPSLERDDVSENGGLLVTETDDGDRAANEGALDGMVADVLTELWNEEPDVLIEIVSASLQRSAEMMQDIVEETKSDLLDFARHREEIDRKQAATRAILDEAMAKLR